jgi:FkbM family methyltransferase
MDVLAGVLRHTPEFKGKWRLTEHYITSRHGRRVRILPGGLSLSLNMGIPYEAAVWLGLEERTELEALDRLLKPGDVFVDCGANIGLWSLVAAPLVGYNGAVIAFEPNPVTAGRLREHASQAQVIEVHEAALADRAGEVKLDPGLWHNVARVSSHGSVAVPATTIDEQLTRPPTGIKLDVEGHELAVLQGASRALDHRPWVAIEFNTELSGVRRLRDWSVHWHLERLGYRASDFAGRRLGPDWGPPERYANVLYLA